jgi:hypothetical protein
MDTTGKSSLSKSTSESPVLDSYNSDKVRLQDSIKKVYDTLKKPQNDTQTYRSIEEESGRLLYREEAIYRMVSTITVLAVLFTGYRAYR